MRCEMPDLKTLFELEEVAGGASTAGRGYAGRTYWLIVIEVAKAR